MRPRLRRKLSEYSLRDLLVVALPILLVILAGFWLASRFIKPAPPDTLTITTGAEGAAYQYYAARYKAILARNGIKLQELRSEGSVENLRRLRDGNFTVDVGLVQGGTAAGMDTEGLVSLGSLCPEPVWVFYRGKETLDRLTQLKGKRVAVGVDGSGTRQLALLLLEANGIKGEPTHLVPVGGLAAAAALIKGDVDAVMLVGAPRSGAVWTLLYSEGVKIMSFSQAEAYTRRYPFLSKDVLPAGGIDFVRNIPDRDISLVSATATLVAREDTHPALINLLMQAANEVHSRPGLFQKAHEYPNATPVDFELSKDAEHYFKSGPPLLQRYLPFWAATLVDRTMVMLIPIIALLLPLLKIAPGLYTWRVKSRIFRYYGELMFLEAEMESDFSRRTPEEWRTQLTRLENLARHLPTPRSFMDQLYTLRSHIEMVRATLERLSAQAIPGADDISA
ncbi:MAG: TAXI family TRAP transporter solute-binding subunit [Rhodocyclaceae bacterium]|nr:TAXI family TRAP transporter solute-binding subunit [Rhodocyclaceae bacterium]